MKYVIVRIKYGKKQYLLRVDKGGPVYSDIAFGALTFDTLEEVEAYRTRSERIEVLDEKGE